MISNKVLFVLLGVLFSKACLELGANPISQVPGNSKQILFVVPVNPSDPASISVKLHWFERDGTDWSETLAPVDGVAGRGGFVRNEAKIEGDLRTPTGIYPMLRSYGMEKSFNPKFPYHKIGKQDYWVDDPKSKFYNQQIKRRKFKQPQGFHKMYGKNQIYKLFVVIEHNTEPIIPEKGSMLFVHPWDLKEGTYGCIGMDYGHLKEIIKRLDIKKNPVLMILHPSDLPSPKP